MGRSRYLDAIVCQQCVAGLQYHSCAKLNRIAADIVVLSHLLPRAGEMHRGLDNGSEPKRVWAILEPSFRTGPSHPRGGCICDGPHTRSAVRGCRCKRYGILIAAGPGLPGSLSGPAPGSERGAVSS